MSAHKHAYLDEAEARRILEATPEIAEMYGLRILAQRRLLPVTTEAERQAAREYNAQRARERGA